MKLPAASGFWNRKSQASATTVGALTLVLAIMVGSGAAFRESALLITAVTLQAGTGAVWWLLLVRGRSNAIEAIGAGLALGTISAVFSAQLLRSAPLAQWAWAAPAIITAAAFLIGRVRTELFGKLTELESLGRRDWLGLGLAIVSGLSAVAVFWLRHPLSWDGYVSYNVDVPFQEALAHSVHLFGPNDSIFVLGQAIRYHWLTHAWMGAMSDWANAAPFVVVTRLTPLVALASTAMIAWAWARRLISQWWVPSLAGILLVGGAYVGIGRGFGDHLYGGVSPSQSFSTPWLLLFPLVLTLTLRRIIGLLAALVLTTVTAFSITGGKVSHAAVIAGGMIALFLLSLAEGRSSRTRVFYICLASAFGVLAGYWTLIHGGDGNGLKLGLDRTAGGALGLEPLPPSWNLQTSSWSLGVLALTMAIAARLVGFVGCFSGSPRTPEAKFGIGVAVTAFLLLTFTTQTGTSQLYFALSGSVLLTVLSAVGVGVIWDKNRHSSLGTPNRKMLGRYLLIGSASGMSGLLLYEIGDLLDQNDHPLRALRWGGPLIVWGLITFVVYLISRRNTDSREALSRSVFLGIIALMAASVTTLHLSNARELLAVATQNLRGSAVGVEYGWHLKHWEAAIWLRNNSEVEDAVVSNRLCSDTRLEPPDCSSRWFLVSSVAQRRMWIEGFDYGVGVGPLPDWAAERVGLVRRIVSAPEPSDYKTLKAEGIKYIWLDCQVDCQGISERFGSEIYRSSHVAIFEIGFTDNSDD